LGKEQLSVSVRYLELSEGKEVTIKEYFLCMVEVVDLTGLAIKEKLCTTLAELSKF
jgi:hypothetical protein